MKKNYFKRLALLFAVFALTGSMVACNESDTPAGPEQPPVEEFDGVELSKLVDAGYRTDNTAGAGNYEIVVGNCTSLMWEGDIMVVLDLYNEADADPVNAVLPNGTYLPDTNFSASTYNASSTYVEIMLPDNETLASPIMGEIIVEREGPNYTITINGALILANDMEFSARYTGPIAFAQRGTAEYDRFDKDQQVTLDHAQGRYWGGWFYPFADDLALEFFQGEFDENYTLVKGYYLHLGNVYMPKLSDYNASFIPLAEGTYQVRSEAQSFISYFAQPFVFEKGSIEELYGQNIQIGTYLTYVDKEQNINKIGLVKDGSFSVVQNGTSFTLTFDFVTEEGVNITGSYEGELNLENWCDNDLQATWAGRPWTSLTGDHTYNIPESATGEAYLMGDYIRPGKYSWMVMIAAYDNAGEPYGDFFTTEIITASTEAGALPTGTFEITWEDKEHVMLPGYLDYAGGALFTYYGDLTPDAEGYSSQSAPIASGSVTITQQGENYHFSFDLTDDGGNKITGEWSGPVTAYDLRDAMTEEDDDHDHDHAHALQRLTLKR